MAHYTYDISDISLRRTANDLVSTYRICLQKDNKETISDPDYLVVIRLANEIRDLLKANNDRIYYGTTVHRVIDRFYIKSCAKCHKFGHYHAE